jgi:hypothetical protein
VSSEPAHGSQKFVLSRERRSDLGFGERDCPPARPAVTAAPSNAKSPNINLAMAFIAMAA